MPRILLTGAAGYIGSHTWLALLGAGFDVIGVDNFANAHPRVLDRLSRLTDRPIQFEQADVRSAPAMGAVLARHPVQAAIHFAALKAVGESAALPLEYYDNNITGLLQTLQSLRAAGCQRMVYSSSATVYGEPETLPIIETAALGATNVYGRTKLFGEHMLDDLGHADPAWRLAKLRYFNPVGAHESGEIGEAPRGTPNNLMPYVAQVAGGHRPFLSVYGDDYPTADGTGVRDYIHIDDLAHGHVRAVQHLLDGGDSFCVNLGTGRGHSVLEVVQAYSQASGREIPIRFAPRRPGDVAACWADPGLARQLLGWQSVHDLARMCQDSWRWQTRHPQGFDE
ncbi:MAG: UDP-glucose 4-epimerase GalE [Aquabacterium sp.]